MRRWSRIVAATLGVVLLVAVALGILWFGWDWKALIFWRPLVDYINPADATGRKDTVQVYAIIVAGVVGALTALAAVGNLIISRKNLQNARETLQQQRQLDVRRAQDDALQAYFNQIGELLTEHELKEAKPDDAVALLARAQTLTVTARLDARRKRDLLLFLYGAHLIFGVDAVVNLFGADFSGADLKDADLGAGANLRGANLYKADLRGAILSEALLMAANLYKADLRGASLGGARLMMATLVRANLSPADLSEADLTGADLGSARLSHANLRRANLGAAILNEANLTGAALSDAYLTSAKLKGAILRDAHFRDARLRGADLRGADLRGADFHNAHLWGAHLYGAKGWTEDQLTAASTLGGAEMPNGTWGQDWLKDKEGSGKDVENE